MARTADGWPPALVLGGAANALSVARALGRAGIEVVYAGRTGPAGWSRYTTRFAGFDETDLQAAWLDWLPAGPRGAVILPCSDDALELIARHRAQLLAWGYRPIEANDELLLAMLDKQRTYALAEAAGLRVPRTQPVNCIDDADQAIELLGFPMALKPLHSHLYSRRFAGKGVVVRSVDELHNQLMNVLPSGVKFLLTELIPGEDDSYCSYYTWFDEDGRPLFHFTKRKLRQLPVGFGTGTYHEIAVEEDAATEGLRLFQELGLRGLGNVEFKRDSRTGTLVIIECNLRMTLAVELIRRGGLDLAHLAYARAAGLPLPALPGPDEVRQGLHQWHPVEDFRAFLQYRAAGTLTARAWLRSLMHRQVLPLFALDDLVPSLRNGALFGRRVLRKVTG